MIWDDEPSDSEGSDFDPNKAISDDDDDNEEDGDGDGDNNEEGSDNEPSSTSEMITTVNNNDNSNVKSSKRKLVDSDDDDNNIEKDNNISNKQEDGVKEDNKESKEDDDDENQPVAKKSKTEESAAKTTSDQEDEENDADDEDDDDADAKEAKKQRKKEKKEKRRKKKEMKKKLKEKQKQKELSKETSKYFDEQASEAESDDDEGGDSQKSKKKKKKKSKTQDSNSEDDVGSSDDEEKIKREMKGFLVDSDADNDDDDDDDDDSEKDSDENSSDGEKSSDDDGVFESTEDADKIKKKKSFSRLQKKEDLTLDADDLDLIAENAMDTVEGAVDIMDNNGFDTTTDVARDSNNDEDEILPERIQHNNAEAEGDEMDDFIEDDLGAEDEVERYEDRFKGRGSRVGILGGPTRDQIQEAMDIFGEDFDLDDIGDEGDEEVDELMGEPGEAEQAKKEQRLKQILSRYDRETLVEKFCTPEDESLRKLDIPERMAHDGFVDRTEIFEQERNDESILIGTKVVTQMLADEGDHHMTNFDKRFEEIQPVVVKVLQFLQNDYYEVPFIWTYRKEHLHYKMTRAHLWFIYEEDLKWFEASKKRDQLDKDMRAVHAAHAEKSDERKEEERQDQERRVAELDEEVDRLRDAVNQARSAMVVGMQGEDADADNILDDENEDTTIAKQEAAAKLETSIVELESREVILEREKTTLAEMSINNTPSGQLSSSQAATLLRLFPLDRYKVMADNTNEDEG